MSIWKDGYYGGLICPACGDIVQAEPYVRQGYAEPDNCRTCGHPDTPEDAYGPGYVIHNLDENFNALCALIGPEAARMEVAEIINNRFAGRR